jgi:PatG C-terminal
MVEAPQSDLLRAEPHGPSFVYALGQIDARYPSLGVEKEFAQASALLNTTDLTERQIVKKVITDQNNRYLARSLCWLLLVGGIETYLLAPRDPPDLGSLIEAYRPDPGTDDVDVVIGQRGQIAPPEACNGIAVPIVAFDRLYSFTRKELIDAIPVPQSLPTDDVDQFRQTAGGVFNLIVNMADNAGATDEHRALNYLTVRYPRLYAAVAEAQGRNASLSGLEVRASPLSGVRTIVEAIFSFTDRQTDVVEKQFARVDVTEEYPFLVTKLGPYFER